MFATPEVSPDDAQQTCAADEAVLLDVREGWEWESGHAPGAVHVPMRQVPGHVDELRDRTVHVVCYSGARSGQVTRWLRHQGVEAANVRGGMKAWVERGLPIEGRLVH